MDPLSKKERLVERFNAQHLRRVKRLDNQKQRLDAQFKQKQSRLIGHLERIDANFSDQTLNDKQRAIVEAALELLHTTTLDELSLRDIAKTVHMQAPALYWHFKNKAVLIDFMAEAMLQKEFSTLQVRTDEPWDRWLLSVMLRLRKAMLAYPDGGRVVAGAHPYPAVTLGKIFEFTLASLHSAGIPLGTTGAAASTAIRYTFGYVIEEQSSPSVEELKSLDMSRLLKHTPYTAQLLKGMGSDSDDERFIAGSELIIAGIKATLKNC
ncbi:MAG TPA: TetR/AcrR family transcriptional regulator C-terminal domain-containing protein [Candidatus Saccharimonadales bacterium]|nr:TetR/AcrR family transcriptional regulator C-terminal domain-containing protein [Candidatus Saccharimonadales bacterium]